MAKEGIRNGPLSTTNNLLSLLLMVGVISAGVAGVSYPSPTTKAPAQTQAKAADQAREMPTARLDSHGQLLPEGAVARLGTLRWRASGNVTDVAFAPDGKTIAAGSRAGIDWFDLEGKFLKGIHAANTSYSRLAFSPDGTRLLGRCLVRDGARPTLVVQLWEVGSRRKLQEFRLQAVQWVGWSAEGEPLAVLLEKGAVVFHELVAGKRRRFEVKDLPDPRIGLMCCGYAPARKLVAFPDRKCAIHVLDVSTGSERGTIETGVHAIRSLALSPDGNSLACWARTGDKEIAQLWDVTTGKIKPSIASDQRYPREVLFAPDGKTVAVVGGQDVRFHDVDTGRETGRLRGTPFIPSVAFSPDSKTMAIADGYGRTINLWDVRAGKRKPAAAGHLTAVAHIEFSPGGRRVVTTGSVENTIILWDPTTGEAVNQIGKDRMVRGCFFAADGRTLFSGAFGDVMVERSDVATGRVLHTIKIDDPDRPKDRLWPVSLHQSEDRKSLVVLSHYYPLKGEAPSQLDVLLTGWDTASRKPLFCRRRPWVDFGLAVSPDVSLLAVSQGDEHSDPEKGPGHGPIRVEELVSGELVLTLPELKGQTMPLAFSPDNRFLVTNTTHFTPDVKPRKQPGRMEHTLRLWETVSAAPLLTFPTLMNTRVAFSRDGTLLALTDRSREILVWDLLRGKESQRFKGLDAEVSCLAFSPNGQRLFSGLSNSTLLVWAVTTRKAHRPAALDAAGAARAWAELAGEPRKAFAARGALALSPKTALPLLKERLKPVQPADAARLRRLIAELDGDTFAKREAARKELEQLGDRASGALQEALKRKPSLETHRRIEALLKRLRPPITDGETLRALRAVAVLEDIGTPESRTILEALAKGATEARLTNEAKAALQRLGRRSAISAPR